jgi:hypothetical protein
MVELLVAVLDTLSVIVGASVSRVAGLERQQDLSGRCERFG